MRILYNIGIQTYFLVALLASAFNKNAKKWVTGQLTIFEQIPEIIYQSDNNIWVHAASLGEFEQGKTIIDQLKTDYPNHKIILTFFSPSAYEHIKEYRNVDYISYLPLDSKAKSHKFISRINPKLTIFIKSEFWFNYINILQTINCPHVFVSNIFRSNQYFFQFYGLWFRNQLKKINELFVQDENSKHLLEKYNIKNVSLSGDTRIDSVYENSLFACSVPFIKEFKKDKLLFIAGSTHLSDEKLLFQLIKNFPDIQFIIAPHHTNPLRIKELKNHVQIPLLLYSEIKEDEPFNEQVLIIDSIGLLAKIYQYADLCYIGGGFNKSIHNILEVIVYGKAVIFGPRYNKFIEANNLIELNAAFCINSLEELLAITKQLAKNETLRKKISDICINYVRRNIGATNIIMNEIKTLLK